MMNQHLPDLTPSRAPKLVCPKRFHVEHVQKAVQVEWSQNLAFANGLHAALKRLFDPRDATPVTERCVESLIHRSFREQYYPDAESRAADISTAVRAVTSYSATAPTDERILDVEVFARHSMRATEDIAVPMGARFDALAVCASDPETLKVLDYKATSPRGINLWGACAAYVVAHGNLSRFSTDYGLPLKKVVLDYRFVCSAGLVGQTILDREDVRIVWEELKEAAGRAYGATDIVPIKGEHCCGCPVYRECHGDLAPDVGDGAPF